MFKNYFLNQQKEKEALKMTEDQIEKIKDPFKKQEILKLREMFEAR